MDFVLSSTLVRPCTAFYVISVRRFGSLPASIFFPLTSGFLQIPPHDGHPCLRLTLPTAERVVVSHHLVVALAGRTGKRAQAQSALKPHAKGLWKRSQLNRAKGVKGKISPCGVQRRRLWWGLGQRPNCFSDNQFKEKAQARCRQRSVPASNFALPQKRPQAALLRKQGFRACGRDQRAMKTDEVCDRPLETFGAATFGVSCLCLVVLLGERKEH